MQALRQTSRRRPKYLIQKNRMNSKKIAKLGVLALAGLIVVVGQMGPFGKLNSMSKGEMGAQMDDSSCPPPTPPPAE